MSRFGVFLLCLLWAVLAQAEPLLRASVDRTRLEAGESLELTLKARTSPSSASPTCARWRVTSKCAARAS